MTVPPLPELLGAAGRAWDTSPAMITVTWGSDRPCDRPRTARDEGRFAVTVTRLGTAGDVERDD